METNLYDKSYFDHLEDPDLRRAAEQLIYMCGIHAHLKGSDCLVDAIILYSLGCYRSFCAIYEAVGAHRGIKPKTVQRAISYCIEQAPGISSSIAALSGYEMCAADIHSSLVIAHLGKKL